MRDTRREAGRLLITVVLLVGLSAGAVYWKRVVDAPEDAFQRGLEAFSLHSYHEAAGAWQQAEALGHPDAASRLAVLYLEGHGVERNHRRAFELLQEPARVGDPSAQLQLARLYESGRGTSADMEQAVLWYWSAAKNDLPEAQLELGRIYSEGRGVDPDLPEAAAWYQRAAAAGLGDAQLALGLLYKRGRGVAKNHEKAVEWLSRAAEDAQLAEAWYQLGIYHEQGLGGLSVDLGQAAWCYEKAAKDFHTEALYRAGRANLLGRGVPRDADAAVRHFRKAAAQGHTLAMVELARAFERGEGARRSRRRAQEWYGKAAEQGDVGAMAALQELDVDRRELSGYQRRRLAREREAERERQQSERTRKMSRPGRCELYSADGPVIEMRTRMDCLNRGGSFRDSAAGAPGSFSTVESERGWDRQRRDLNRRRALERRRSRAQGYDDGDSAAPLSSDWVACYSPGARDRQGRGHYRCSSPMRKSGEMTTSWCRDRGYRSRRLFKHQSSARTWVSENCH